MKAQQSTGDKVLVFSGTAGGVSWGTSRNLDADTSYGSSNSFNFAPGISYGKWKGNRLTYVGIGGSYTRTSFSTGSVNSAFSVGPLVGMMKRVSIGGPLYYAPFGEAYAYYTEVSTRNLDTDPSKANGFSGGLFLSPFSFGVQASKKMDLLLSLGRFDAYYTYNKYPGTAIGSAASSFQSFSLGANLNNFSFRVLLRI